MDMVTETLHTPVKAKVDVVVCGAGPAGCTAAIAAARAGASVMLVEYFGFPGGIPAAAGVNGIGVWNHDLDGRPLIDGLPREIVSEVFLKSGGDPRFLAKVFSTLPQAPDYRKMFGGYWLNVNPEMVKIVLDEMLAKAAVHLMLQTQVAAPLMENGTVSGVIVESKSGREAILAGCVIDATGDGDIAARAGAEFRIGRPGDSLCQPMSQIFLTGNTDYPAMYYGFDDGDPEPDPLIRNRFRGAVAKARAEGVIRENPNDILCAATRLYPGLPTLRAVNFTRVQRCSAIDADELTRALTGGRRQVAESMEFIRRYVPGGEHAVLAAIYPAIGVRESRRIIGDYLLTGEDVKSGARFPDAVARGIYLLDIHNPDEIGKPSELIPLEQPYDIPYRALLPAGVEGILTAGRCISGDHIAQSSYRIMSHCMAMGEAAGTAAALACRNGVSPRALDPAELRAELERNGTNTGSRS